MSFNIDVCVAINDYHHLRGGGGWAFIKELHNSHVGLLAITALAPQFAEQKSLA